MQSRRITLVNSYLLMFALFGAFLFFALPATAQTCPANIWQNIGCNTAPAVSNPSGCPDQMEQRCANDITIARCTAASICSGQNAACDYASLPVTHACGNGNACPTSTRQFYTSPAGALTSSFCADNQIQCVPDTDCGCLADSARPECDPDGDGVANSNEPAGCENNKDPACVAGGSAGGGATGQVDLIPACTPTANANAAVCERGLVPCGPAYCNICQLCHLFAMLINIVTFLFICLVPPMAVLGIVGAGLSVMFAGGDPSKLKRAKDIMKNTVIGLVLIYGAWVIVSSILTVIGVVDWTGLQTWFQLDAALCPSAGGGGMPGPGPGPISCGPGGGCPAGCTPINDPDCGSPGPGD